MDAVTRSIRFDEPTEKALRQLVRITGLSIAEVLRQSVLAFHTAVLDKPPRKPWITFTSLNPVRPARSGERAVQSRSAVAAIVIHKRRRSLR